MGIGAVRLDVMRVILRVAVCHKEVEPPIVVVIRPADAHSRAHIVHSGLRRHIRERAIPVVSVKILSSKIVDNV